MQLEIINLLFLNGVEIRGSKCFVIVLAHQFIIINQQITPSYLVSETHPLTNTTNLAQPPQNPTEYLLSYQATALLNGPIAEFRRYQPIGPRVY